MGEAVPDVAFEEAPQCAGRLVAARRRHHAHFSETHLKYIRLSGSCTRLTRVLKPQASACWCSGMWPTSSWWILKASRIRSLRFFSSISDWIFAVSSSSFGLLYEPRL